SAMLLLPRRSRRLRPPQGATDRARRIPACVHARAAPTHRESFRCHASPTSAYPPRSSPRSPLAASPRRFRSSPSPSRPPSPAVTCPAALVLAPTRELAAQIHAELHPLLAPRSRRVASFYGGVGFGPQLKVLRR